VLDRLNRHDLTDEEWDRLQGFLPADPTRGGQDVEKWFVFLARHLERTIGRPDLAWWELGQAVSSAAAGFVAALVLGRGHCRLVRHVDLPVKTAPQFRQLAAGHKLSDVPAGPGQVRAIGGLERRARLDVDQRARRDPDRRVAQRDDGVRSHDSYGHEKPPGGSLP
jgi:hypothetical protein